MSGLRYIVLVTDENGTESAYGPWSINVATRRSAAIASAFPRADVRMLALLTLTTDEVRA